ncbi:MAG TPA: chemotaxis protein CheW [Bacteroidales bacterium]|nr:chemotaxis protein CheW [Bacteroidales bacterium]
MEKSSTIERKKLPDDEASVLKRRAQALAVKRLSKKSKGKILFVAEFLLGEERYGIEVSLMQEVYPLRELTPLPGIPPFILGIINVRGKILPVMNIKKFFDIPEKGITELNRVLIVAKGKMVTGILADEVLGVRGINPDELQPPMATLTGIKSEYLRGITAGHLIVLDMARILDDPDIIVNKNAYQRKE